MFGSLGFAIWSLLHAIPGGWQGVTETLNQPGDWQFFSSGIEPQRSFWDNVRSILESEYTIWAALIGSTFTTLATHGTDQDMVQRMLTAKDHHRSRLIADSFRLSRTCPLVMAFLFVGILLWAFYQQPGKNAPFAYYIVHELPPGLRGVLIAGIFATAMGSLSTALNALATSFTEDWYRPYIRKNASQAEIVRAARISTVVFSVLFDPYRFRHRLRQDRPERADHSDRPRNFRLHLRFAAWRFPGGPAHQTPRQRSGKPPRHDLRISWSSRFSAASHNDLWTLLHPASSSASVHPALWAPAWLPRIEFPWRIAFGAVVTFAVAVCFKTPEISSFAAKEYVDRQSRMAS